MFLKRGSTQEFQLPHVPHINIFLIDTQDVKPMFMDELSLITLFIHRFNSPDKSIFTFKWFFFKYLLKLL